MLMQIVRACRSFDYPQSAGMYDIKTFVDADLPMTFLTKKFYGLIGRNHSTMYGHLLHYSFDGTFERLSSNQVYKSHATNAN